MCLKSKCCNSKTRKDQYGTRRCNFCLLPAKLNFLNFNIKNVLFRTLCVLLLWTIAFPQTWFGVKANTSKGFSLKINLTSRIANTFFRDVELNDSSMIEELHNQQCQQIPWALAQFHIETRKLDKNGMPMPYTSDVCLKCKNVGGVRFKVKGSKAIGQTNDNNHYLIYSSYKDCISDYVAIQNGYLSQIEGHYAEDKKYVGYLKTVK